MLPHTHFLFPYVIGLLLNTQNFLHWKATLLAGLVGMFIDIDHYIEHIIHAKRNKFSIKATWNNSIKLHKFEQRSFIHHWQGILIITLILILTYFYFPVYSSGIALGYYSHLFLDYIFHKKGDITYKIKIAKYYFKISKTELWLDIVLIIIFTFLTF
jgi:hypothetical protein